MAGASVIAIVLLFCVLMIHDGLIAISNAIIGLGKVVAKK